MASEIALKAAREICTYPEGKPRGPISEVASIIDNAVASLTQERDALREALGSLAYSHDERDKGNPCWCYADSFDPKCGQQDEHLPKCQFARAALATGAE